MKKFFPVKRRSILSRLCLGLATAGILLAFNRAEAKTVRVGAYENHPKVFTQEDGTIAGIFPDIIEEVARREGWDIEYVHGSWPECLQRLETGEIDLMVDIGYTAKRAEIYDFCETDVICNWAQIYTQPGMKVEVITELNGKKIAGLRDGIHMKRFIDLTDQFGIECEMELCGDYQDIFELIDEKKVDAGIVNRIFGYSYQDKYAVERSPIIFSPASLRFATRKGTNRDLIAAIDKHLTAMKNEDPSAYHQSIRQWLGETSKLTLPQWIFRVLTAAGIGIVLLLLMSSILKYQVSKRTARLRITNAQLEAQVAETMRAHLELKQSEEKLIRQERLSALGQMTSGIAHDFNNMLTPVLGYSDLLLETPGILKNPEEVREMLVPIRQAAVDARSTVKRIQEFNRADPRPKMEKVPLADLISRVVRATRPLWKTDKEIDSAKIRIEERIPPGLEITASHSQLSEALMNLMMNAIHAMPDGGTISIEAVEGKDTVMLNIRDTGTGMTREVKQRCVEPFFSTKGEDGTGMGLAMVHGIVKRHNGTLRIDSVPGQGTTISILLPKDQHESGPESPGTGAVRILPPMHVLVVDDDPYSRKLLQKYLERDGHQVTTAVDVPDGIRKFDEAAFELVITDRAMPGVSGDRMAEHVKASAHPAPVLMITGFLKIVVSQHEYPVAVDHIMGKPYTLDELRAAIFQTMKG